MSGMPKPSDNHRRLDRLAGTWVGEETIHPSPFSPGGTATGRYDHRVDIDGFFLIQDYRQERNGQVYYRGHGIFGWDDQKKEYTWFWVDSTGQMPGAPSRGQWDGDTLQLLSEPWGDGRGRYTYQLGDGAFRFRLENSRDAGKTWQVLMEAHYRKL